MSSKDKDKSLQDKLKNYFKKTNTGNFPIPAYYAITSDIEREISSGSAPHKRLKALRDLEVRVLNNRLESSGVERIWKSMRDMLGRDQPKENRHFALSFLCNLVQGQFEDLGIMRAILFNFVTEHDVPEDQDGRFKLLQTLTDHGKNIKGFEEEIGRFLLDWMSKLESTTQIQELLELIVNVVKYNAAYLDDDVVCDIVNNCCYLCRYCSSTDLVLTCLKVLEATVCYTVFPHSVLHTFVTALCRTVNSEHYCVLSWKIMHFMLGTDLGHAALFETIEVLNGDLIDAGLTRGAVFYINMALWGSKRVPSLKATHTSVLPAFLKALEGEQLVVTYEVNLALEKLIALHGPELHEVAWEMVFLILRKVIAQVEAAKTQYSLMETRLHELITAIEQLHERGQYLGDVDSLIALIDTCGHSRSEASVSKLITYKADFLTPSHADWLGGMASLVERYCRQEKRTAVRTHTLQVVHKLIIANRRVYEEELLERVVLPHVAPMALDADTDVRLLIAQLFVDLALHCNSKSCQDLLSVLEKVLNRQFDLYVTNESISLPPDTRTIADIRCVVDGLVSIFHHKLLRLPSSHAVKTYLILLSHLEKHYNRPSLFQNHPYIRLKILELFLSARANKHCHIGFCYDASDNALLGSAALRVKAVFSPYVCVEGGALSQTAGPHSPNAVNPQHNISYVSIRKACKLIVQCLAQERDWSVLHAVLREIPHVMQNKPLVLSKHTTEIDQLASVLCSMVMNLNAAESLVGVTMTTSQYHGHVLPVLASLAPYHLNLEPQTQQKIVKCLIKFGLVLRTPQQVISALTIYTLETRDTMLKLLPEVLLKLSQISHTSQIAVPILEFLSTLTRLPQMFASFVDKEYLSVFAILLPYTNPSRYNHYVVSLAHHVIAAWFLKCRLIYRRNFVKYIIQSLHNFSLMPFEEAKFNRNGANEDSSNRMRSSSLGSKGRDSMSRSLGGAELLQRSTAGANALFHQELTETCVDLMARYTFSPCSVRPRRGPTAEFMFDGGQSCTWLVGHELITITTSGCQQNSLRQGLCDRCLSLCKRHSESISSPSYLTGSSEPIDSQNNVEIKRQNSSENRSGTSDAPQPQTLSPKMPSGDSADTQAQLSLKLENLAKQEERGLWARTGACVCWCAGWVEVHVRRPTGDVSWVMRMQNQMNFDASAESPLNDIIGLLAPSVQGGTYLGVNMSSSRSSGLGDSRNDILSDTDPRSRSGSSSSQHKSTQYSPGATGGALVPPTDRADLQKSNSDSVVSTSEKKPPHASTTCIVPNSGAPNAQPSPRGMTTEPIDIPGSPQRQSSTSTTTDEDDALPLYTEQGEPIRGKTRHPVRRSNSSPEMSSSWQLAIQTRERVDTEVAERPPTPPAEPRPPTEMILLPSVEPTVAVAHHHQKKPGKNKDMRVSCEAIPEEMYSSGGTPPSLPSSHAPHPLLATFNSDPGQQEPAQTAVPGMPSVASDTALNTLAGKDEPKQTVSNKSSKESVRPTTELKVLAKPPQSPAPPASPGRLSRGPVQLQATSNSTARGSNVTLKLQDPDRNDLPPLSRSKRSNTISVMSPTRKRRDNPSPKRRDTRTSGGGGGVTPAFVLLQLYHNISVNRAHAPSSSGSAGNGAAGDCVERPLLVSNEKHERSIKNLDLIPPVETYRVGVLYVGPGQTEETQILRNEFGSIRYGEFLRDLGTLIALDDADKHGLYLNIERGGKDGHFLYVWQDDIMQVHFHVATLMPNSASDPTANEKRKHIGNDYVTIVYNDSGADFNINTIKGQFNLCIVMIEPLEHGINRVTVKTKEGRIDSKFVLGVSEFKVISDQNVALLARQLALHCTLASLISQSLSNPNIKPYASNSLERLRQIKRLRQRLLQDRNNSHEQPAYPSGSEFNHRLNMVDFTEYT